MGHAVSKTGVAAPALHAASTVRHLHLPSATLVKPNDQNGGKNILGHQQATTPSAHEYTLDPHRLENFSG